MQDEMMFLDCPAYLDAHGAARCGLPAEIENRYSMRSSDGPLDSAKIRCPRGHWFNGPLESLILVIPQAQCSVQAQARPEAGTGLSHRAGAAARGTAARER